MKCWSDSFSDGAPIPARFAFGKHDPESHVALSENENPHLAFSGLPEGTRSLALICHDPDVPSRGDDVNQEGRVVPADLPRVDFFHWILVDLDPQGGPIREGEVSRGITPGGKPGPESARGRVGLNGYTQWFAGDAEMAGDYFGYDGPCPPWNDAIVHHYHFTLYALDVARCPVTGAFGGAALRATIDGHVLARAAITGTYTLNPDVAG